jgi:hypothetical protein
MPKSPYTQDNKALKHRIITVKTNTSITFWCHRRMSWSDWSIVRSSCSLSDWLSTSETRTIAQTTFSQYLRTTLVNRLREKTWGVLYLFSRLWAPSPLISCTTKTCITCTVHACVTSFVVIWQNLSNHILTRLKRFVPIFTDKLCN